MQEHKVDAFVGESETAASTTPECDGEVAFISTEAQVQRTAELRGDGAVIVDIPSPPASRRGKLAEYLDDLVERSLGVRGAPPPYLTAWSSMPDDAETRLADQLSRARTIGATGLVLAIGSLDRIAAPALTPEDSTTLRMLADATRRVPLILLLDDSDTSLGAHCDPIPLLALLVPTSTQVAALPPLDVPVPVPVPVPDPAHDLDLDLDLAEAIELVETNVDARVAPVAEIAAPVAEPVAAPIAMRDVARLRATVGVPVSGPSDFWRSWAIALGAARGPQPLVAFERLFIDSYMPLANAIAEGLDDPRAIRAHDEFRSGFERSYTDAFATFGATGRRPRLVMDAFDVAVKQARLHNARTTHVLVVDGMRHDLGCLVRDEIAERASGTASLTSESLLWSALPTTTYRQLETLARGIDALRAPATEEGTDSLRGRTAETVRRLRVGSRELYKLDVVPSMLGVLPDATASTSAAHVIAALDDIAASVADAILHHVETLPPRTLLLVLGDHGFAIDRRGRISQGGASPEEVLVPCLAYLVGELH